jgi:hypothetical protein
VLCWDWDGSGEPIASRQAQRACPWAHVVKVARFVGSGASCMTPRGRLTRAGRLRSVGSTRIDEGATRHEMLMIDIETGPSATSPKWIDKGVVGG